MTPLPLREGPVNDRTLITPEELALRYKNRITTRTLANWRSLGSGHGPTFLKIGGRVLYPLDEVLKWEARRMSVELLKSPKGSTV